MEERLIRGDSIKRVNKFNYDAENSEARNKGVS